MNKKIAYAILIFFVVAFTALFIFWWKIRTPLNSAGEIRIFKVEKGESAQTIAENLKNNGFIKSPFLFRLYVFLSLDQYNLKPGEYELSPNMSVRDIGDILALGGTNEVLIVIPEGFNLKQVEDRLIRANLAKPNALVNFRPKAGPPLADKFLEILSDKPISASLEGYLFPDSYRFFKDAVLSDVVSKMVNNLSDKLTPDLKMAIKNSSHSTYEILTMASLVEKEVSKDSDRPVVAGILWKRLKAGMPLQVDATLVYITGRNEIGDADKKIDSRYNTYFYRGLPKGPISNPGISAIKAAIYPETSPYWYYLSAKDGTTIFSKTLEEHNRNRAIWLK
ncbi:MAG: endolytic transglycosylase MltG [Candidatus Azambacteria bacterium]|nr:endolytic transglycosylase MltG [Candidatus Azambacteria bacterium]